MTPTIQPLKKVTLSLTVNNGPGRFEPLTPPASLMFVYGVASDGLCPFETALAGRGEGERLAVEVKSAEAHAYFGHLFHPLGQKLGGMFPHDAIALEIEVTGVTDADDREVVQAAARALAHGGCGASCGCGCGC